MLELLAINYHCIAERHLSLYCGFIGFSAVVLFFEKIAEAELGHRHAVSFEGLPNQLAAHPDTCIINS